MEYFKYKYIVKKFNNSIFFLYFIFINNFKMYRNIYRILNFFILF